MIWKPRLPYCRKRIDNFIISRNIKINLCRSSGFVLLNPLVKKNVFGSNSNMKRNLEYVLNVVKAGTQNLGVDRLQDCLSRNISFLSMFKIVNKELILLTCKIIVLCSLVQGRILFKEPLKLQKFAPKVSDQIGKSTRWYDGGTPPFWWGLFCCYGRIYKYYVFA